MLWPQASAVTCSPCLPSLCPKIQAVGAWEVTVGTEKGLGVPLVNMCLAQDCFCGLSPGHVRPRMGQAGPPALRFLQAENLLWLVLAGSRRPAEEAAGTGMDRKAACVLSWSTMQASSGACLI